MTNYQVCYFEIQTNCSILKIMINMQISRKELLLVGSFVILLIGLGDKRIGGRILGLRDIADLDPKVRLVVGGDVMLGRSVNTGMVRRGGWVWPFEEVAEYMREADVALVNLEAPFGDVCPLTDTGMIFCADKRAVEGLVFAGIDGVSLENNHGLNQGVEGKQMSEEWLEENGVWAVVGGEVEVIKSKGLLIGVVAFDDVSSRIDEDAMVRMINLAEVRSDVVVVQVHWGWEYRSKPNGRQVRLGRMMVDAGADVVVGHHPHWVQTVEEYNDGLIIYSLGNLVFDQMWSEETRKGWLGELILSKDGVERYEMKTVKIYDYGQPRLEGTTEY